MQLTHISLTDFRNFARLDMEVPAGPVLLVGANGQGKTSLVEAIYFLATFTSFHALHDRELVNFLAARKNLAVGRIEARFDRDGEDHRLEVRIIQETNGINGSSRLRKEVLFDGLKKKVGEVVGEFIAVLFLPQMVEVIEGAPEERRRFINLAMTQVIPGIRDVLNDYTQALSNRNALLKQIQEFGGDRHQLDYWDEILASKGSELIFNRIHAIKELERFAARNHQELTRGEAVLRLSYQPAYDPLPEIPGQISLPLDAAVDRSGIALEGIRRGFVERLESKRETDIMRGVTTIGPHRDEMRFLENGIDLGTYGSRGQVRTAMLSLKMAETTWMEMKTGHTPVLLLDEALAELDPNRRLDLLNRLANNRQTLLTTTDLELFSADFIKQATLWNVSQGRIELAT
jgi:DNA replication and repair protein RecF